MGVYTALFLVLISPNIFNFEFWPLSRNDLYGQIYPTSQFRLLGFYGARENGEEIYINTTNLMRPFFLSHANKNLWRVNPVGELDYEKVPVDVLRRKLKTYLRVINFNLAKNSQEKITTLSLYHVEWDRGLDFEQPNDVRKLRLITKVRSDE